MREPHKPLETEKLQELVWIRQCRSDLTAFENIFIKYHDRIFNYILRRTANVSLAQDLTANTFCKAVQHVTGFQWKNISLSAWLYRIATNEVNLNYRKRKRVVPLTRDMVAHLRSDEEADTHLTEIEENILKNQKFMQAAAGIQRLKPKFQAVLTLKYFEGKAIREIAEILELPENTVKTHLRRALIQLRKIL